MFKIIAIVIILGTGIAIVLNYSNILPDVTAGDWLGFWGAYIGGIATLTGVLLTLWKSDKDKREDEEKLNPQVIPLYMSFIFKYSYTKKNRKLQWLTINENIIEIPQIKIVNIGARIAKEVELTFIPYNDSECENVFIKYNLEKSEVLTFLEENIDSPVAVKELLLQVTNQNYLKNNVYLKANFVKSIEAEVLLYMQQYKKNILKESSINLGIVEIKYYDTYLKEFILKYETILTIKNLHTTSFIYLVEISFKRIKDK